MVEKLDVDRVIDLLDIVHKTVNLPNLGAINRAAIIELTETDAKLAEEQAEAKKKAEEEDARKAAEVAAKAAAEAKLKAEKEKQHA